WRWRALGVLAVALLVAGGPVMGLAVPWRTWLPGPPARPRLRVLTCNVHGHLLTPEELAMLLANTDPDVIVLQSWSSRDEASVFRYGEWHLARAGELCVASHYPVQAAEPATDPAFRTGNGAAARFDLDTPVGTLHLFNVHLASPRRGLEAVIENGWAGAAEIEGDTELRRRQSEQVRRWAEEADSPLLLAGDFNTPPDSVVFRQCWSGYPDAFAEAGF